MEMLDPRILQGNTTQIGDIARNVQAQRMQLQGQQLQNTQNAQNYGAMVIAQAAATGNPALYNSARQKLSSMGIDVSPYSEDPAEAAQQAQQFRMMGATPTAQLSALMQQKQMQLRAQAAGIDPSTIGLSGGSGGGSGGMGGNPSLNPPPLSQGSGDPANEFLAALADAQAQNGVSAGQNPALAGVPQYDPAKYRTYKEYENALKAFESQMKNDPQFQALMEAEKVKASGMAKKDADTANEMEEIISRMPQLEEATRKLSELGKKATYTGTGQALDFAGRQLGLKPREAAVARAEYISRIDNEILPLLRQTFGAQFTEREGESLKATLGNPNMAPDEKDAVLKSFIETKKATVNSMARELGRPEPFSAPSGGGSGGIKFLGWE